MKLKYTLKTSDTMGSNDGALDAAYGRDEYGRIVAASNAVAQTDYVLCESGSATNESWRIGTNAFEIVRSLDGQGRLRSLAVGGTGYSQFFDYTSDNLISTVSNDDAIVTYAYADDRGETGYTLELANGSTFTRTVTRDPHRPGLVASVTNRCGSAVRGLAYTHDDLSRPISRNVDTFGYNERGEVVEAMIEGNTESHAYDLSGNSTFAAFNAATNFYTANNLNQYVSVIGDSVTSPTYTADGGLVSYGPLTYAYDSASRLASVSSNDIILVTNDYDSRGRRVRKTTSAATHTFLYDEWNLIHETVTYVTGETDIFEYFWGRDLSCSLQGAGGVGGLLYVKLNGVVYIPFMDANGNITAYVDSTGSIVAEYVYDCFGRTISQTGPLADVFHHRFSSKYFDVETELYYYGYRFYSSQLCRWLNRDPIAENGGVNVYSYVENYPVGSLDALGLTVFLTLGGNDRTGAFADQSSCMRRAMSMTLEAVKKFNAISKGEYDCLQKKGLVFFNGESFRGTFSQYKKKLNRELKLSVAICRSQKIFIDHIRTVAKESTEKYDFIFAAIHGEPSFSQKGTMVCWFDDGMVLQEKLRADAMTAMQNAAGTKDFVSCYQTSGRRESIQHYKWPKLHYVPGKKIDYQVHSVRRIQL